MKVSVKTDGKIIELEECISEEMTLEKLLVQVFDKTPRAYARGVFL